MAKKPTPAEPTIKRGNVRDYLPAEINPNKSNPRGVPAIVNSLHQFGAGRSIIVDRDGEAIGGSHTLQAAIDAGITDVIEVESDGDALIVHKRRDLDLTTDAKARGLQIADNRTSELGYTADDELLAEMLTQIGAEDARFVEAAGFDDGDIKLLMGSLSRSLDDLENEYGDGGERDFWPVIRLQVSPDTYARYQLLMRQCEGDEAAQFTALMDAVDETVLSSL